MEKFGWTEKQLYEENSQFRIACIIAQEEEHAAASKVIEQRRKAQDRARRSRH